jgi:hypothetical protein
MLSYTSNKQKNLPFLTLHNRSNEGRKVDLPWYHPNSLYIFQCITSIGKNDVHIVVHTFGTLTLALRFPLMRID